MNAHITLIADQDEIEDNAASMWRRLRRLMQRHGLPFFALRGPEYAPSRGHHMHFVLHLPKTLYGDVAAMLADVTGEPMAWWFDVEGRDLGAKTKGVVCVSVDGRWMLQRHIEGIGGTDERLVEYASKSDGKHRSIGRHQRSADLIKLTKASGATVDQSEQQQPPAHPFSANGPTEDAQSAVYALW